MNRKIISFRLEPKDVVSVSIKLLVMDFFHSKKSTKYSYKLIYNNRPFSIFNQQNYEIYKCLRIYGPVLEMHGSIFPILVTMIHTNPVQRLMEWGSLYVPLINGVIPLYPDDYPATVERINSDAFTIHPPLYKPFEGNEKDNLVNQLNDACLTKILNDDHLRFEDVLALGRTCVRMQKLAKDVIEQKYKHKVVNVFNKQLSGRPICRIDDYLFHVGASITTVNIDTYLDTGSGVHLGLLSKYSPNVKRINMFTVHCCSEALDHFITRQPNLDTIYINDFARCKPIRTDIGYPTIRIPQLTTVKLEHVRLSDSRQLQTFCQKNAHIKNLVLKRVAVIGKHSKPLSYLTNVASLQLIDAHSIAVEKWIDYMAKVEMPLEEIRLNDIQMTRGSFQANFFENLGKFKRLKCVELTTSPANKIILRYLLEFVEKNVVELQRLKVASDEISPVDVNRLVEHMHKIDELTIATHWRDLPWSMYVTVFESIHEKFSKLSMRELSVEITVDRVTCNEPIPTSEVSRRFFFLQIFHTYF